MRNIKIILTAALLFILDGCKLVDVRTDSMLSQPITEQSKSKGRDLLEQSVVAMGYDKLASIEAYEVNAIFDWRLPWSIMPVNSLPGSKNNEVKFRFRANSFDGQIEHLEGRKKGKLYGVQSWETYRSNKESPVTLKNDKRRKWGLAAYHYMLEAPYRLLKADIVTYAGFTEFEDQQYDLVFVSWSSDTPHKEHDQWLLYINQETHFVDMSYLTIRDFFMPFPPNLAGGTVRYLEREKTESGIFFPKNLVIQLMKPKKEERHVYEISLSEFKFDEFDEEDLRPFKKLIDYGDSKPVEID